MPDHGVNVVRPDRNRPSTTHASRRSHWLNTLRSGWEFDLVFRTGLRVQGELVRLLYLKLSTGMGVKFGCTVGKRQGKAHVRVRGRRILREAFRHVAPWLVPDVAFVLSLKDKGLKAKATDVCDDLVRVLKRRDLLLDSFPGVDWYAPVKAKARAQAKAQAQAAEQA